MEGDDPNSMPAVAIGTGYSDTIETELIRLYPKELLNLTITTLNNARRMYLQTKNKDIWDQMNKLLPNCYNQRRTVMLNYEVLAHIYHDRKDHKLDEWREFCKWIETLPFSEIITGEEKENELEN